MRLKSIKEAKHLFGQRVLVRVDFNVPIKSGRVGDNFKIQKSLPTIKFLLHSGARVILVSHLGRPKKKDLASQSGAKKFSLLPVAKELQKLLDSKVAFEKLEERDDWEGKKLVLLENIRFYKGEENNDQKFAKELAGIADLFVLDGFAVAHRDAASVSGIQNYLPSYAGLLLDQEIAGLSKILEHPKHPFVVLLGGIKMETKIPVLKNLLPKADKVLLAGGIINTYLSATGNKIGCSAIDEKYKKEAKYYVENRKMVKPVDMVAGTIKGKNARVVSLDKKLNLKKDEGVFDIGPNTVKLFSQHLKNAKTIIWNGAPGFFEQPPYNHDTYALVRYLAARSKGKAYGVCGGGETVEILRHLEVINDIDLVSTGGGAMLEFLSGKKLPGLKKLIKK
ncbi:MAG: phosphoglycerate kinase [Candidatus Magasanikbacteria bacterium]|nr:phosphoglycerate kinase [Candidatus Magasanikbacteria bacterium]